ncbi:RNA polymerase II C-terminal domain phosphatase-like 3 [Amborella trichopoda]|nr:RNA polymerase II C-terminal domain phosphatase-like 3 [Amborella trichopoda]|eukprot:XP_006844522.3 RNA polymerase II C-terminal domain phosphatase-like 3 [Amborella trichopoda]
MHFGRYYRFSLNPKEKESLTRMSQNQEPIEDMEEGEISDQDVVQELFMDDLNQEEINTTDSRVSNDLNQDSSVFLEESKKQNQWGFNLLKLPHSSGIYGTDLYNFAWAQAVQNKPLEGIGLKDFRPELEYQDKYMGYGIDNEDLIDEKAHRKGRLEQNKDYRNSDAMNFMEEAEDNHREKEGAIEADNRRDKGDEIEEGELEEGEIELDSPLSGSHLLENSLQSEKKKEGSPERKNIDLDILPISKNDYDELRSSLMEKELEMKIASIGEMLKAVTIQDANKSIRAVCYHLKNSMETMHQIATQVKSLSKNRITDQLDFFLHLAFAGIQSSYSVYRNTRFRLQEEDTNAFLRLLKFVKFQTHTLFNRRQMEELEGMLFWVESAVVDRQKETQANFECVTNQGRENMMKNQDNPMINFFPSVITDGGSTHRTGILPKPFAQNLVPNNPDFMVNGDPVFNSFDNGTGGDSKPRKTQENLSVTDKKEMNNNKLNVQGGNELSLSMPIFKDPSNLQGNQPSLLPFSKNGTGSRHVECEDTVYPSVNDALKAFSTYQQKFGRTSFLSNNKLPSPTPSDECEGEDTDAHGEVSSTGESKTPEPDRVSSSGEFKIAEPVTDVVQTSGRNASNSLLQKSEPITSNNLHGLNPSISFQSIQVKEVMPEGNSAFGSNPLIKSQPRRSRDPRLANTNSEAGSSFDLNKHPASIDPGNVKPIQPILNGGILGSRKTTIVEEAVLDGHSLKRQRGLSYGGQVIPGRGGWLEENTPGVVPSSKEQRVEIGDSMKERPVKPENGAVLGSDMKLDGNSNANVSTAVRPGMGPGSSNMGGAMLPNLGNIASLPDLIKDIVTNPNMILQLIQKEQQRLGAFQKPVNPLPQNLSSSSSTCTMMPSSTGAPLKSSDVQQRPALQPQMPPQTASMSFMKEDVGKPRMKPRDPRRILHTNLIPTNVSSTPQPKPNGTDPSTIHTGTITPSSRESNMPVNPTSSLPLSTNLPDITQPFTKKLMNIADILSGKQVANPLGLLPQVVSQPAQLKTAMEDGLVPPNIVMGTSLPEKTAVDSLESENPWGDVNHLLEGLDDKQRQAIQKERARRIEEQNKMFSARKLCLVLDLDHTLLNSAKFIEVDQVHDEILRKKEEQDRLKPRRHLFRFPHMGMWTKLRPGIWNFLERASKLYELHLYTMGNKVYATEMAKVLDPTGSLFSGRVISKGDDGDPFDGDERLPKSKDLDGVLGMESAVVIIDDSAKVWPHHKHNLIVVERYTYFPCSRRQFGLHGPSLLEIDHDERPEDGTLASSLAVIEKIHESFFSNRSLNEVDVRDILASEQQKILKGCKVVFSRVFHVGLANPHLHPLWQTAEQFGAICTNQIDDEVTHVVAISLGTDKVNWAISTGRYVVHPGWLEASALLYRRANERDFSIMPPPPSS